MKRIFLIACGLGLILCANAQDTPLKVIKDNMVTCVTKKLGLK